MNPELNLVAEKEKSFQASAPTFYKDITRTNFPTIKFEVTIQNFPSFFSSEKKQVVTKTIEIPLQQFQSIDIASIDELPFRKYLMILREENKKRFIADVTRLVIHPNEFVKEIKLNNFKSGNLIYDTKIENVLQGKYSVIFSIPDEKNKKSTYRSFDLASFFDLSFSSHKLTQWSDVNNRKTLLKERIGFTKQSPKDFKKGYEVEVWVGYPDLTSLKYYVFMEGLKFIKIEDRQTFKLYYLYSLEIVEKLEKIYTFLAKRHPTYRNIEVGWLFFDEVIQIQKESKNYREFKSKLNRRIKISYENGKLVEKIEARKQDDKYWESNKYSKIEFSQDYVSHFDDHFENFNQDYYDDVSDNHLKSDFESDFYSSLY